VGAAGGSVACGGVAVTAMTIGVAVITANGVLVLDAAFRLQALSSTVQKIPIKTDHFDIFLTIQLLPQYHWAIVIRQWDDF